MRVVKFTGKLLLPIPELRGKLASMSYPAFGEVKIDGEFTFVVLINNRICTINKYNKVRTDFKALSELHGSIKCKSAILLAELYYGDGKRNALYDLNRNKESDNLHIYVFDIIELDGKDLTKQPLIDRRELLLLNVPSTLVCQPKVLSNRKEAEEYFNWSVNKGYEGAVIKSMDSYIINGPCNWVKIKMKDRTDYAVDYIDPTKERIEVRVPHQGGIVRVGVKASLRYKRHLNVGDLVTIEHQGILDSGSLRHPVLIPRKEWK